MSFALSHKIVLRIDGLPKMANGGHGSWGQDHKRKKKWKTLVARELVGLAPPKPFSWIYVEFIRHSSVEPDYDGLVHGFKALRDALVKFGFVKDDKNRNMEAVYRWEKAEAKKGFVEIVISAVTP